MENCGRGIALLLLVSLAVGCGRADDVFQTLVCNQSPESSMEGINYVLDDIGRHANGAQQDFAGFNFYSTAPNQSYYGRGSCSASMTVLGCARCINKVISIIKDLCGNRIGGMASLRGAIYDYFCELRFEKYSF